MTIKIKAYQKYGIKTNELVDEFEFCCWEKLKEWLDGFSTLHSCSSKPNKEFDDWFAKRRKPNNLSSPKNRNKKGGKE